MKNLLPQLWQIIEEKHNGALNMEIWRDAQRLLRGEPLDYIIGRVHFGGATIDLSRHPLILRRGTENWERKAIEDIKKRNNMGETIQCLDIFAGSGCMGIAILKNIPQATVDFADIDSEMLKQIEINLKINTIDPARAKVIHSDIFKNINKEYDYIFANPPYVPLKEKNRVAKWCLDYEPHHSFFAGDNGSLFIKPFLREARKYVRRGGKIWMEYEWIKEEEIEKLLESAGYEQFNFHSNHPIPGKYLEISCG